jgi:NADH-quinone oxidoreductase subunit L
MTLADLAWIPLLLPLGAAVMITLFTLRAPKLSAALSIGAVSLAFVVSLVVFALFVHQPFEPASSFRWLQVGDLTVDFGLQLDPLSLLMLLIVTGVAMAIHIYSWGYMGGDPGFARFFASMSFFTFSMLGIVLATNFVMMFVFWELVGLSSYLLIGFWYERPAAAEASKKAFITNRLGDCGFLLGIILLWVKLGSVGFATLSANLAAHPEALGVWASVAGLLIFCGAVGKSAQFPLHVWLPDAMEGPTPVSALIHAATMVAAGVYMLCRVVFLFGAPQAWPPSLAWLGGISALDIVAWVGGFTALLAAVIAVQQDDIKRILAYSTLSQLGYMVMAVGVSPALQSRAGFVPHDPTAAMYHLSTHAFFKALLFLGAGSVIHALHHEQNIWKMGGLKKKMPVTYWTFLAGTLALAGLWPFSGFFSKDEIIDSAYHRHLGLFVLGVAVALLTTFYMFRLVFVAFHGAAREPAPSHAHESSGWFTWPLVALAVPSVVAAIWGLNLFLEAQFDPGAIEPAFSWTQRLFGPFSHAPLAALAGLGAVAFGFSFAYGMYAKATADPLPERFPGLARAMRNRFYFDEIYQGLINVTHEALARLAAWCDQRLIDGFAVRGISGGTEVLGRALRLLQTGNLQTYAFLIVLGVAVVLIFFLR